VPLKRYIYGYLNRIQSSRRLSSETFRAAPAWGPASTSKWFAVVAVVQAELWWPASKINSQWKYITNYQV
jgi:hypothetical protein